MALGTWALAIGTVVFAFFALQDNREALEQSQTAWVAPIRFSFVNLRDSSDPLKVRVFFQNVGREPAKTFKVQVSGGHIGNLTSSPEKWGGLPMWTQEKIFQRNELCKNLSNKNSVLYPSPIYEVHTDTTNTNPEIATLFNEIKEQRTMFLVFGCTSYETMGRTRYSTFCEFLSPLGGGKDIAQWLFMACPVGNDDYNDDY